MRSPSQQVSESQPGASKLVVEPDTEVVQCYPRRQTSAQTTQLMGPLPVKAEGIQELVVNAFHDLAEACHPSPESLGPASLAAVAFGWMDKQCSISFEPAPMVFGALETFVGHVAPRGDRAHARKPRARPASGGEEGLGQRLVGGGSGPETEARNDPRGAYGHKQPEALVPSQPIAPSDVGVTSQPSRASTLGVPNGHGRTIESLVRTSVFMPTSTSARCRATSSMSPTCERTERLNCERSGRVGKAPRSWVCA